MMKKKNGSNGDDVFKQYLELDALIKEAEAKKEALRGQIFGYIKTVGEKEFDGFTFGTQSRKKWSYPEEIQGMEDMLKRRKKAAEESGSATYIEAEFLVVKPTK